MRELWLKELSNFLKFRRDVYNVLLQKGHSRVCIGTPLQYSCLENPMDGGAWQVVVHGVSKSWTHERLHFHFSVSCIGEGNGNPLQCSCLENPRDGGAQCAAIYGVAQSRTRLKRLSSSSSRVCIPRGSESLGLCGYGREKVIHFLLKIFLLLIVQHD